MVTSPGAVPRAWLWLEAKRKPMEATLFGYTEAQIAQFGLTFGVGAFILYMLFIVFNLARESKAGKFGTFILFLAKNLIQWVLGI